MNKSLVLLCTLLPALVYAQSPADTILEKKTTELSYIQTVKAGTSFKVARLLDGNIIALGDTLYIGSPSSQNTQVEKSGGSLTASSTFNTLHYGKPNAAGVLIVWDGPTNLNASWSKRLVVVERILVTRYRFGNPDSKLLIGLVLREPAGAAVYANRAPVSIQNGELILKNRKLTKAEAIEKLKEAKTLLELGVITEDDYLKIFNELSVIIKENI
jgi:hypothetical protein